MTEQTKLKTVPAMGTAIKKATEIGMSLRKHMGEEKFAADPNPLKTFRDRIHEKSYDQGARETAEKLNAEWEGKYAALKSKKGSEVDLNKFVAKNIPFDAVHAVAAEFGFGVDTKKFKEALRELVYIGMELAKSDMVADLEDAAREPDEVEETDVEIEERVMAEEPAKEEDSGEWDGLGEDDDVSPETAKLLKVFESEMDEEEPAPRVTPMKPKISAKDFLDSFDE